MRRLLVMPVIGFVVLAFAGSAYADDIKTNVVAGGNDTIKLTGSSPGQTTIKYWINETSGGGDANGCNVNNGNPATITIHKPAAVSVTPATLTFTACGENNAKEVTFSSSTPGDYSITASVSGGRNNSIWDTKGASFTLKVVRPNTPPQVSISGVTNGASYEKGSVPAAYCNVTDAEDGGSTHAATLSAVSGPLASYGLGSQTASCSYTDAGGLTASAEATYSIVDTTAPVLTLPGDITAEATGPSGAKVEYSATATDAVDPSPSLECSPASGGAFPLGETTVSCTATDAAGNRASGQFIVSVGDRTAPRLNLPEDATIEATGPEGSGHEYEANAEDTVDGPITPSCAPASGSTFPLGGTPVNCEATDKSGNTATGGFNVTVQDTTPPSLDLPANKTIEAIGPDGAGVQYEVSAADLVAGTVEVTCDSPPGSTFGLGTTTVSCTATDGRNLASGSFTVTVEDTTKPVLTLPEDMTFEATKPQGADVAYAVSATDLVDVTAPVECEPANGTFPLGTTTVNCSATDKAGNTAEGSFKVTVQDTTAPVLSDLPASQTLEATGPDGATATFTKPTASDLVDGAVEVTCDRESGSVFALGDTTVTCAATDNAGNAAKASFVITVQDTTAPELSKVPDSQTLEATGTDGATATFTKPTASDLVDGAVAVTCDRESGDVFPLGVTTVTCTAADKAGNKAESSFAIAVQDTTAPDLTAPADKTVEATGPDGAKVTYDAPSAHDLVDGERPVSCEPASGSTFGLGATTVTCTAEDTRGNKGYGVFVITVQDTTAPEVDVPADKTIEATGPDGAEVNYTASASDLVDENPSLRCEPASGSVFGLGATTVSCTAEDASGNKGYGEFTITVQDTTGPAITVPNDITKEAAGPNGVAVSYTASASDLVDGEVTPLCTPASGGVFPLGKTTVTCTAVDSRGNPSERSFTVTVVDTTKPTLQLPADISAFATSDTGANVSYSAQASDLVDGAVTPVCTPASGSQFGPGATTVTCTAEDAAGNKSAGTFNVVVSFDFRGFLAPVDSKVLNGMKAGSTVPIKWQVVSASGGYIGDVGIVSKTGSGVVSCSGGLTDELESYTTGNTSLRYDATNNQYVYNWQSPKQAGKCYRVTIALTDGRSYSAQFQLK